MKECTVAALNDKMAQGGVTLIDVRDWPEFAGGRIASSRLVPLAQITSRSNEIDRSREVHLICRTGRRSAEAAKHLESLGFENVVNVTGGFEAWKKESLPFDRDEKAPWSIERQVRFTAGLIVFAGVLLSIFVHPYFIVVPAFIGFGLAFTATIDWCGMGLLISKMPWNRRAI